MGRSLAITPGTRAGANGAAMALLLIVAAGAPRAAVAQESHCGGFLPAGQRPGVDEALGFDHLPIASTSGEEEPVPGRPCQGPSCSQAPAPQPAAAPSGAPPVERWVVLDLGPTPQAVEARVPTPADARRPSNPSPDGLLRPPRTR